MLHLSSTPAVAHQVGTGIDLPHSHIADLHRSLAVIVLATCVVENVCVVPVQSYLTTDYTRTIGWLSASKFDLRQTVGPQYVIGAKHKLSHKVRLHSTQEDAAESGIIEIGQGSIVSIESMRVDSDHRSEDKKRGDCGLFLTVRSENPQAIGGRGPSELGDVLQVSYSPVGCSLEPPNVLKSNSVQRPLLGRFARARRGSSAPIQAQGSLRGKRLSEARCAGRNRSPQV